MRHATDGSKSLRAAIEASGYYPEVVAEAVFASIASEEAVAHLVHHEATIDDRDEVRRHVTVLVLTPSRLLLTHTDEHAPDEVITSPFTSTTTEAISLDAIRTVVINRIVTPQGPRRAPSSTPYEVVLTLGWGAVSRIDLEPADCGDPGCDSDHGYTGVLGSDDFSLRVSTAAEGPEMVQALLDFSNRLSELTAGPTGGCRA